MLRTINMPAGVGRWLPAITMSLRAEVSALSHGVDYEDDGQPIGDHASNEGAAATSAQGAHCTTGPGLAVRRSVVREREPWDLVDLWFRPKRFETERLYVRLGARILKRYVPTGGDLVMEWIRRRAPRARLIDPSLESLRRFERWTRIAEAVHLLGFIAFASLIVRRFSARALSGPGSALAAVVTVALGLWPVVLQRYNRLRIYRAIEAASRITSK
jgi:hypothetical protein